MGLIVKMVTLSPWKTKFDLLMTPNTSDSICVIATKVNFCNSVEKCPPPLCSAEMPPSRTVAGQFTRRESTAL